MKALTVKRVAYALGMRYWHHKRCEANVLETTARWRMHAGKDTRCELGALFNVEGHYLCKRHAGDYLLAQLCTGEEVVLKPDKKGTSL